MPLKRGHSAEFCYPLIITLVEFVLQSMVLLMFEAEGALVLPLLHALCSRLDICMRFSSVGQAIGIMWPVTAQMSHVSLDPLGTVLLM